jgi:hypothetical protein
MDEANENVQLPFRELIRRVNWKTALPFGSNIRETIQDIKIIRGSLKKDGTQPGIDSRDAS